MILQTGIIQENDFKSWISLLHIPVQMVHMLHYIAIGYPQHNLAASMNKGLV